MIGGDDWSAFQAAPQSGQPQPRPDVQYAPGNSDYQGVDPTPQQKATVRQMVQDGTLDPKAPTGSPANPFGSGTGADVPPGAHYIPPGGGIAQAQPTMSADMDQGQWSQFVPTPANATTSQSLGFLKGVLKPLDNAATGAEHAVDAGAVGLEGLLKSLGVPTDKIDAALVPLGGAPSAQDAANAHLAEGANANQAAYFEAQRRAGVLPGKVGEFAGNVVGTLPIAAVTQNPWLSGAAAGGLLTDKTDPVGIGTDMVKGAIGGKIGDVALNRLTRVVQPVLSDSVKKLIGEGVQLTPGQIMGGMAKGTEDKITSLPFLGDVVKGAQGRSLDSFNRAAVNRTLAPLGEALPATVNTGHDAVAYAGDRIGQAYDSILPHVQMTADQPFADSLASLHDDISTLAPPQADQLASVLNTNVFSKFQPGSTIDGDAWKSVDSKLGQIAARYGKSPDPDHQQFADIVRSVQSTFRDTLARQNPAQAPTINAANEGWANLVRVEKAAGSSGATNGVFTAPQLNQAVKASDNSVRGRAMSRGEALMQDLSNAGKNVLPSSVPDSGTAGRGMLGLLALGGGGAGLTHDVWPAIAAGAAAIPYTPIGQKMAQVALTQRPSWTPALADLLSKLRTPANIAGANALVGAKNGGINPASPY